jgi:hypothetical protein
MLLQKPEFYLGFFISTKSKRDDQLNKIELCILYA